MNGLDDLRRAYPWPTKQPPGTAEDWGWMSKTTKIELEQALGNHPRKGIVLELGTLYGQSAKWWLRRGFDHVVCVDLFQYKHAGLKHFEDFCHTNWEFKEKLTPVKMGSQAALCYLKPYEIPFSVVYIDASHEFGDVVADAILAHKLYPQSLIIGDDYHMVNLAVEYAAKTCGFRFWHGKYIWAIK